MIRLLCFLACWSACGIPLVAADDPVVGQAVNPVPPSIVLILVDDLGYGDVGCYGNDFVDTPHIDALAQDGLRFTDFYASAAVCSPTRFAIQSGQNPARGGITAHIPGHWRPFETVITPRVPAAMPLDVSTVGECLQTAGWATGYIGKWHLGNDRMFAPSKQGYEKSVVINGPHLPSRYSVAFSSPPQRPDQYRTEFEADLAVDFIRNHSSSPYFLMVSPFAVHIPLGAMSEKAEKYRRRSVEKGRRLPHPIYAAMIEHVDDMVGRIVAAVEATERSENTMIVFTSDNGGLRKRYDYREDVDDVVSDLSPLRGEKGTLYEGGIRIPTIIRCPSRVPAGVTTHRVAVSHDFYPTFAALAGADLPANQTIDGVDLSADWLGDAGDRPPVYWHYPHYHHDRPASAVRDGRYKLIEALDGSGEVELFDLETDIAEAHDLAASKPGIKNKLLQQLRRWRTEVNAQTTVPNPSHDPDRAGLWYSYRSGGPIDSGARKRFPPTEQD